MLNDAGANLHQVVAYQHVDANKQDDLRRSFRDPALDWVGISSPAIARQVASMFPDLVSGEWAGSLVV